MILTSTHSSKFDPHGCFPLRKTPPEKHQICGSAFQSAFGLTRVSHSALPTRCSRTQTPALNLFAADDWFPSATGALPQAPHRQCQNAPPRTLRSTSPKARHIVPTYVSDELST